MPVTGDSRVWHPGRPVPVALVLGALIRGRGDPCHRVQPDGVLWRATRTPEGPALLRLQAQASAGTVEAHAWGAGSGWALDGVPELLGGADDPAGFVPLPGHPRLVAAWRSRRAWRVPRTLAVFEALVPAVLEQRVTGPQARAAYQSLLWEYGEVAPGPAGDPGTFAHGMRVAPSPRDWAGIPSWAWLRAGVEQARSTVVLAAAGVAGRLEETLGLGGPGSAPGWGEVVAARLRVVPGVGVWTAAEIRQRAHGDPDAFSWSDFHVAKDVTWALTGRVADDAACAELIEPYRGHRYRVQRLLELDGASRPRRGPRITLPTHLPRVPR